MRRLVWTAAALAFLGPLGAAPAAEADHVTASVSATASLGRAVKLCYDDGQFCARGRRVIVSWQASCGPNAPPDALRVSVSIVGIRPDGTRFTIDTVDADPQPNGSERLLEALPGLRFVGEVTVTCVAFVPGGIEQHVSTASASSAELFLPPQLKGAMRPFHISSSCRRIPTSKLHRWLQARKRAVLTWELSYVEESLLAPGIPEAGQITLFARGAGIRVKRAPSRAVLRRHHGLIGLPLRPRRAGTLRIWATVNGHRTNTLDVRVLPC